MEITSAVDLGRSIGKRKPRAQSFLRVENRQTARGSRRAKELSQRGRKLESIRWRERIR